MSSTYPLYFSTSLILELARNNFTSGQDWGSHRYGNHTTEVHLTAMFFTAEGKPETWWWEEERESIAPAYSHAHFTRCAPRRRLLQQQTDHRHEIPQSIIERAATISHFGAKPCLCGSPTKRELPPLRLFRSIKIRNRYGDPRKRPAEQKSKK